MQKQGDKNLLTGSEKPTEELDEEDYDDAVAGWYEALQAVKEIAEGA